MGKLLTTVEVSGVRGYVDGRGIVWVNTGNAAIGLGIIKVDKKDGVEYTRVNTQQVKKMLIDFGKIVSENGGFSEEAFPKTNFDELTEYIPEPAFYYMAMRANNETARKFQYLVTTKILPQIRKTGTYGVKVTPQQRLRYLDRIKRAANARDREMLDALYSQCQDLGIVVPRYEIPDNTEWVISGSRSNGHCAIGLPAIEWNENGTLTVRQHELVEIGSVVKSLKDWCCDIGLSRSGLRHRLLRGWALEDALTRNPLG